MRGEGAAIERAVWSAHDPAAGRRVALKLCRLGHAAGGLALLREHDWLEETAHEQLPAVRGLGVDHAAGWCWLALEFVEGIPLDEALRRFGPEHVPELLAQACRVLAHLHEGHQLVHGDLKPDNVLVGGGAGSLRLRLIDLGLSSRVGTASTGVVRGTRWYAAPSVLRGEPPTPQSDLYSLGIAFIEGLTGGREASGLAELDLEPVAARLLERMVRTDEDTRARGAQEVLRELTARVSPDARSSWARVDRPRFVGRVDELSRLEAWLGDLADGAQASPVVFVEGPPGIGCSRLLEEVARRASESGSLVVRSRAPAARDGSHRPLAEVLDALAVASLDASDAAPVSELARRLDGAPAAGPDADPSRMTALVLEAQDRLEHRSREAPLLIVVDGLDPEDAKIVELLELAAGTDGPPARVGYLCAVAPGASDDLLRRIPSALRVTLARLDEAEAVELAGSMLRGAAQRPDLFREVAASTEGHPQFLVSTCQALLSESAVTARPLAEVLGRGLPATLVEALERRLGTLDPGPRRLVARLCVADGGLPLDVARAVASVDESGHEALDDLIRVGVLRERRGAGTAVVVEFASEALRALARARLSEPELALHHEEAVTAWQAQPQSERRSLALAEHALALGRGDLVAEVAPDAVEHLLANQARTRAIELARRALALPQLDPGSRARRRLLEGLADAYEALGDLARAREGYEQALPLASEGADRARVLRKRGLTLDGLGDSEGAYRDLLEAHAELSLEPEARARICQWLGRVSYRRGNAQEAEAWLRRGLDCLADPEHDVAASGLWNNYGILDMYRNRSKSGRTYFKRALRIHERTGNVVGRGRTLSNLGSLEMVSGHLREARECLTASLAIKRRLGHRRDVAVTLSNLAQLDHWVGNYGRAIQQYEEALALRPETADVAGEVATRAHLSDVWRLKGDLREARSNAVLSVERSEGRRDVARVNALYALAQVDLTLGRFAAARGASEAGLEIARECEAAADEALLLAVLAELEEASGGSAASVRAHLAAAEERARAIDNPRVLASVLVVRAECAFLRDEHSEALAAAREVERLAEELDLRLPAARAELVSGCIAVARDSVDEASRRLHRAEEFALLFSAPELAWRVYFALGAFHLEQGREQRAFQWFEKCIGTLRGVVEAFDDEEWEQCYLESPIRANALACMETWLGGSAPHA